MSRWIIWLVLVAIGAGVQSDLTWRKRKQERALRERVEGVDRFVDIGVIVHVVVADPDGEELIEGRPRMRIVRSHRAGGMLDSRSVPPRICGPSQSPVTWFCSEDQEPVILHNDADPLGQLVYGSEGAGKTTALAMWHYFRWLEHIGEQRSHEGGQTAPTSARLAMVRDEIFRLYPRSWYRYRKAADILVFADKTKIRFKSTKQQSADSGSPIQGYNWSWCGRDEGQDQVERHDDIEARGRAARKGGALYKQLITATAKDSPDWRSFRDMLVTAKTESSVTLWIKRTLLGLRSPFIASSFWEAKKATMSPREYRRRVLAEDVRPERTVYPEWDRDRNVRPLVVVGARDVTAQELAAWGPNHHILVGYDPGKLFDVSILLKAYRIPGVADPVWWVVDEVTTEQGTTERHVKELKKRLRDWGCYQLDARGRLQQDTPTALVRADPYGNTENDAERPDVTVYTVFRQHGMQIMAAAHVSSTSAIKVGRVPREGRIDMMNTLFLAENKVTRFYVACNEKRQPVAPKLVKAIETLERDAAGNAETGSKDKNDMTHWPVAAGYALWAIEKPRLSGITPSGSKRS